MNGTERRKEILNMIQTSDRVVSATRLAEEFSVSRQVIVQDIALIRAAGFDIISTNRGYILNEPQKPNRIFKVSHTDEQLEDELNTIVDMGGTVLDVFIWHKIYGKISGVLNISSRRKVSDFMDDIRSGRSTPLMKVTGNYHYHTVEAPDEETLDLIEKALINKGYLVADE